MNAPPIPQQLALFAEPTPPTTYTSVLRIVPRVVEPVVVEYIAADQRRLLRAIERLAAGDALHSKPYRLERIAADLNRRGFYVLTRYGYPLWKVAIPQVRYNSFGEIKESDYFTDALPVDSFDLMALDMLERGVTDWFSLRCGAVYCGNGAKVKLLQHPLQHTRALA